jgi:hypothetical protein
MSESLPAVTRRPHRRFPAAPLRAVIALVHRCCAGPDTGAPQDCSPEMAERLT